MCLMLTGALGNRSMIVTQATMSSILERENRKMGQSTENWKQANGSIQRARLTYDDHRFQLLWEDLQILTEKLRVQEGHESFGTSALNTNIMMWWLFMFSSMRAVIRLGQNDKKNLETYKFTNFEQYWKLNISITQNLVAVNPLEKMNVKTIYPRSLSSRWTRSILTHNQVNVGHRQKCEFTQNSVLSLEKSPSREEAKTRWACHSEWVPGVFSIGWHFWISMKKQVNSSGIFSQDSRLQIPRKIQNGLTEWVKSHHEQIPKQNHLRCSCSTTLKIQKKYEERFVFRVHWTYWTWKWMEMTWNKRLQFRRKIKCCSSKNDTRSSRKSIEWTSKESVSSRKKKKKMNQDLMNSVTPREVCLLVSTPWKMGASSDRKRWNQHDRWHAFWQSTFDFVWFVIIEKNRNRWLFDHGAKTERCRWKKWRSV